MLWGGMGSARLCPLVPTGPPRVIGEGGEGGAEFLLLHLHEWVGLGWSFAYKGEWLGVICIQWGRGQWAAHIDGRAGPSHPQCGSEVRVLGARGGRRNRERRSEGRRNSRWSHAQPRRTQHPPTMKAISPVRSVRSCYEAVCCLSEQSLAIARSSNNKSPALEEPMNLLYDMNDCYSKLRELVPGIPQGTKLSQVEILQHVIDYIFDLQIVLEEGAKGRDHSSEATLLSLKVWGCFFPMGEWVEGGLG